MGSVGNTIKRDTEKLIDFLSEESKGKGKSKPIDIDNIKDKSLEGIEGKIRNLKRE